MSDPDLHFRCQGGLDTEAPGLWMVSIKIIPSFKLFHLGRNIDSQKVSMIYSSEVGKRLQARSSKLPSGRQKVVVTPVASDEEKPSAMKVQHHHRMTFRLSALS